MQKNDINQYHKKKQSSSYSLDIGKKIKFENNPKLNLISQIYLMKKNQKDLIINENIFVDYKNKFKQTSLNISACLGLKEIVLQLIKNGANLENQDYKGKTALHNSIEKGNLEISKILINSKIKTDIEDNKKNTVLHYTCLYKDLETLKLILNSKKKNIHNKKNIFDIDIKNEEEKTPLFIAIKKKYFDIANLLIKNKANINAIDCNGSTFLHLAVIEYDLEFIKNLLSFGININQLDIYGNSALHIAVWKENIECIKILIKNKADVNLQCISGFFPIDYAAILNNEKIIEILIQNNSSFNLVNKYGKTSFYNFIKHRKKISLIKLMVKFGVDLNKVFENSESYFHLAVKTGNIKIIQFLIENRVDIKKKDIFGLNSYHYACIKGYKFIIDDLFSKELFNNDLCNYNWTGNMYTKWNKIKYFILYY